MNIEPLKTRLDAGLTALNINAHPTLSEQLLDYLALLGKWNRVYNLTAVVDPLEQVSKHLLDSLAIAPYLRSGTLLDVGTGAGLPGIPLALLDPARPITLLDSNQKKTRFLQQAKLELSLSNVTILTGRAESLTESTPFDTIVCRAFSSLHQFITLTEPLLAADGEWLAMKGELPDEELKQLSSVEIDANSVPLSVPFLDATRYLIRMKRARIFEH